MTFAELLIILAALGILIVVVIPQFSKMRENQVLKSAVGDVLSSLNKARSQTLASLNSSQYGVHFQSDKVIIFTGTVFNANNVSNETINIVTPATISNVALGAGSPDSGDIYFSRLSGSPSATGTITISTTNYNKIITISATGIASSS